MKETKVYVDELPKNCSKCEWCTLNHKDNYGRPFCLIARMPLYNGDKVNEERGQHKDSLSDFECPLQSLKTHDRELVKEVCEKIREHLSEQKKSLKDTFSPYSNGKAFIISAVEESLNKIEKEYEK